MFLRYKKPELPTAEQALPGRLIEMPVSDTHEVLGTPMKGPWPEGFEVAVFGAGCFWGVERIFWRLPGVYSTSAGYAGGFTENPTYEEVCSGTTGHTEAVQVVYDPAKISYADLLKAFWENHDPTQGMRQGNDVGTQYRSAIYTTTPEQAATAEASRDAFQPVVTKTGRGAITTEIKPLGRYYYAEDYHQQYLAPTKNPNGYCNHGPNGMSCPVGVAKVPAGDVAYSAR
ncbi:peptide-methionine (S)-S-oxide reductase MsrA [Actinoplanes sp. RD1]|uniref:peptide-methionine (S)-S-oxide reductase MsrA n=1 Tax=Actinoplanes sp. RD1 TaxID=3064538 RepID=UPI0027413C50|nr:peptide-methionine (S)-S-oxide reductase MsrA [Actinoplanes sp. RD1]